MQASILFIHNSSQTALRGKTHLKVAAFEDILSSFGHGHFVLKGI